MSKVSQSLLKGAKEALAYAKGRKKGAQTHQVKIPKVPRRHLNKEPQLNR